MSNNFIIETSSPAAVTQDYQTVSADATHISGFLNSSLHAGPLNSISNQVAAENPISILNKIKAIKAKLQSLTCALANMDPLENPDACKEQQEKVTMTTQYLHTLQASLTAQQNNNSMFNGASRLSYRDIPKFILASTGVATKSKNDAVFKDAEEFLGRFERVLLSANVDLETTWEHWLFCAMEGRSGIWYSDNIKDRGLTWKKARQRILEHFDAKAKKITSALNVCKMTMDKNESVVDFGLRFQAAYRQAGWSDNEFMAVLCLRALPKRLQEDVLVALSLDGGEVPSSAEVVLIKARDLRAQKRAFQDGDSDEENPRPKKQPLTQEKKKDKSKHCHYHGYGAHATMDCRMIKFKEQNNSNKIYKGKNENLCWFCKKEPYSRDHMTLCTARKNGRTTPKVQVVQTPPQANTEIASSVDRHLNINDPDLMNLQETAYDTDVDMLLGNKGNRINMIQKHYTHENPYVFPLLIQNERTWALLDTGADISIVSHQFLQKNKNIKI